MNPRNITLLQENLEKVVKFLNGIYCDVWYRKYYAQPALQKKNYNEIKQKFERSEEFVLYIHIPFCANKCDYCSYYKIGNIENFGSKNYVQCLIAELKYFLRYNNKKKILSIYIGGGTPTQLTPKDFKHLLYFIKQNFIIPKEADICVEAAPGDISSSMAQAIVKAGITRVILGVQTFNENKLKHINRYQKNKEVYNAVKSLKEVGHQNIHFDLIYHLSQEESVKEFLNDNLKHVVNLQPQQVHLYALQDYKKFSKMIYKFYTLENIKKIKDEIDNKLKYREQKCYHSQYYHYKWNLLKDIIAVGIGGTGNIWDNGEYLIRNNNNLYRQKDNSALKAYKESIVKSFVDYRFIRFSEDESLRKYLIFNLFTEYYGIDKRIIIQKFPNSVRLFRSILVNIGDMLRFSGDKIFLEKDYIKILPFKTDNGYVNYFIFSFCYLYSEHAQNKLLATIIGHSAKSK